MLSNPIGTSIAAGIAANTLNATIATNTNANIPTNTNANNDGTASAITSLLEKLKEWMKKDEDEPETENPYNNLTYLQRMRDQEFGLLKEAYSTIQGDTWETAEASDTVGQKNIQAFRDRWEKILEENEYSSWGNSDYNISSGYGGYAGSDFNTGWGSLLGTNTNGKSGYIGG